MMLEDVMALVSILRNYLVYGNVDILWTYQEAKIKIMILAWLCRFN